MYRLLSNITGISLGYIYPGYQTFKALKNDTDRDQKSKLQHLLKFWLVMATFAVVEFFTDFFIFWFPFYFEFKLIFLIYLTFPQSSGFINIYERYIYPTLSEKEKEIDENFELFFNFSKTAFQQFRLVAYNYMFYLWTSSLERIKLFVHDNQNVLLQTSQGHLYQSNNLTSNGCSIGTENKVLTSNQKYSQNQFSKGLDQAQSWLGNLASMRKATPVQSTDTRNILGENITSTSVAESCDSFKTSSDGFTTAEIRSAAINEFRTPTRNFRQGDRYVNTPSSATNTDFSKDYESVPLMEDSRGINLGTPRNRFFPNSIDGNLRKRSNQ